MIEIFCENMCGNLSQKYSEFCETCEDIQKQKDKEYRKQFGYEWEDLQENK